MIEVIQGLFVGGDEDFAKAKERGYSICSACKEGRNGHRAILKYATLGAPKDKDYYFVRRGNHLALNLVDADDPAFIPDRVIQAALAFIQERRDKAGASVLVHCNSGQSRGPSTALLYMRSVGELPDGFHQGLKVFKALYEPYDPNPGMRQYVKSRYSGLKG